MVQLKSWHLLIIERKSVNRIFLKGTKGENKHKNCIKISVETY